MIDLTDCGSEPDITFKLRYPMSIEMDDDVDLADPAAVAQDVRDHCDEVFEWACRVFQHRENDVLVKIVNEDEWFGDDDEGPYLLIGLIANRTLSYVQQWDHLTRAMLLLKSSEDRYKSENK